MIRTAAVHALYTAVHHHDSTSTAKEPPPMPATATATTSTPAAPIMAISLGALTRPRPSGTADSDHLAAELVHPLTLRFAQAVTADRSACDPATAELFYDDDLPSHRGAEQRRKHREQAAKAICGLCPIVEQCHAHALARPELFGTWGGKTASERARSRSQRADRGRGRQPTEPSNTASRTRAALAYAHAARHGLQEAATVFGVPAATLQRVFFIHRLDLDSIPDGIRDGDRAQRRLPLSALPSGLPDGASGLGGDRR